MLMELHRRKAEAKQIAFPWIDRLHVAHGAFQGLNYLHTKKPNAILHKDIKPLNIFLSAAGNVTKLGDVGLAVEVYALDKQTKYAHGVLLDSTACEKQGIWQHECA